MLKDKMMLCGTKDGKVKCEEVDEEGNLHFDDKLDVLRLINEASGKVSLDCHTEKTNMRDTLKDHLNLNQFQQYKIDDSPIRMITCVVREKKSCGCMKCPNCGAHEVENCEEKDLNKWKWNIRAYRVDDSSECRKCHAWFDDKKNIYKKESMEHG